MKRAGKRKAQGSKRDGSALRASTSTLPKIPVSEKPVRGRKVDGIDVSGLKKTADKVICPFCNQPRSEVYLVAEAFGCYRCVAAYCGVKWPRDRRTLEAASSVAVMTDPAIFGSVAQSVAAY